MADKTTGGLPAVEEATIGSLPGIADLYDDTKIPVEQQGEARHMTGAQWKQYAQAGVSQYVETAQNAANTAQQAVAAVGTSVQQAAASAAASNTAKEGAEAAKESIEDMEVSANTLPTGQPASVTKTQESGHVKLEFGLPTGATGAKGDPGSSIQKIERTAGTGAAGTTDTYTITLTDGTTSTFQVYNGADGTGSGDMSKSVYDTENKNTDIFKYVDEKLEDVPTPDDLVTVLGSGSIDMPETLGPGPYIIEFTDEDDPPISGAEVTYTNTTSGLTATNAQAAIDELSAKIASSVKTFNGRTGAVVPKYGDYTAQMVGAPSTTTFNALDAKVNSLINAPKTVAVSYSNSINRPLFLVGSWNLWMNGSTSMRIISNNVGCVFFPHASVWPSGSSIITLTAFDPMFGKFNGKTPVATDATKIYFEWIDQSGNVEKSEASFTVKPVSYNLFAGVEVKLPNTYTKPGCFLHIYIFGEFTVSLED